MGDLFFFFYGSVFHHETRARLPTSYRAPPPSIKHSPDGLLQDDVTPGASRRSFLTLPWDHSCSGYTQRANVEVGKKEIKEGDRYPRHENPHYQSYSKSSKLPKGSARPIPKPYPLDVLYLSKRGKTDRALV